MTDNTAINRYESWELDTMLEQIERPDPFLLRTFFPIQKMFETRTIEMDVVDRGRRLAPFVSPFAQGKPMRREGYRTRVIAPAYIKPNDIVQPQDSFVRRPGEAYGGRMSPKQRFDAIVAEKLADYDMMLDNRLEWMAAQCLVYGGVRIVGEDYPEQYVDFSRKAALDFALTGAAKWNTNTATPMDDIETAALAVRRESKGAIVTDLVMDGATWSYFKKFSTVQDLLATQFRRGFGGTDSSIDQGSRTTLNEGLLVGNLSGRLNLWVYDSYYQDEVGADQPYIPPGTLLGIARQQLQGTQYFGAIMDMDAEMKAMRMFVKSKMHFNPSGLELLAQSAPMVAPGRIDAMFHMQVF